MLNFIKRQRAGFYLNIVLIVLTIISIILFAMNASLGLFVSVSSVNGGIYACLIISLVCFLASIGLGIAPLHGKLIKVVLVDVLRIASTILLALATVLLVGARIENIGYYVGSDLYLGNAQAIAAVTQAIACIVLFAITWVFSLIAVFFVQEKDAVEAK